MDVNPKYIGTIKSLPRRFPEIDVFRRYILYQTSWPPFKCQHDLRRTDFPSDGTGYRQYDSWRKKYIAQSYSPNEMSLKRGLSGSESQKAINQRSNNSTASSKRTGESEDGLDKEKSYMKEPGKWTPSRFLYSAKYGNLYELNRNIRSGKGMTRKESVWLWEPEYSEWLEKISSKKDQKTSSKYLGTTNTRSRQRGARKKKKQPYCPHADTYATYFDVNLTKQRRKQAVMIIQKFARGWFVRANIRKLIRKSNLKLNLSWPHLMQEYKDLLRRIKQRYHQPATGYGLSLDEIEDYIDRKQTYQAVFDDVVCEEKKVTLDQLKTFFWKCQLYPTASEIRTAVKKVSNSCQNQTDLMILLENSDQIPEKLLLDSKTLCELLVGSLAEDRYQNRIGLVTFAGDVRFKCRLEDKPRKVEVLEKIGYVVAESGPARISEALIAVQNTMATHVRPWCEKVCVILTSGEALHRRRVHLESAHLRKDETELYLIGVGDHVRTEDSQLVVKNSHYDFRLSTYDSIAELADILLAMFSHKLGVESEKPSRVDMFNKVDTMEILWTIYPPKGTGLAEMKKSRWIRPIIAGDEAWSMLNDNIMKKTDLKVCLRLVVSSTLEREGYINIPSDLPPGVRKVTDVETALQEIENYIKKKKHKDTNQKTCFPDIGDDHT